MLLFFTPFTRRLSMSLVTLVIIQTAATGQISSTYVRVEPLVRLQEQGPPAGLTGSFTTLVAAGASDSLVAKRNFFSTTVVQQGTRLGRRSIIQLMEEIPPAQTRYRRSQLLKPVGPLLAATGLVIGYIAVKGTQKTAFAKGIGTPANPSPPDVLVDYTSRSLPQLMGGIGLLVGGLCLIEISNGLTTKSINLYNAKVMPRRVASGLQTIKLGITTSGTIGLEASF